MQAPEIKICGLTTPESVDSCIAAGADYCGMVFFPPSPRNLTPSEAAILAERAGNRISRVGLFVNADDLAIREAISAGQLDIVQLHGSETPERAAQIRQRFGLRVWKALPVSSASDVEQALRFRDSADLVLFDARAPSDASRPGGMGLVFDWSLLLNYRGAGPWGLAGGLTPDNVAEAIRITGAPLVDTSTGVESAPGMKDMDRIAAFCQAARQL